MKYIVVTNNKEIVYGGDGIFTLKQARYTANNMVSAGYGKMTICKIIPCEQIIPLKPKTCKK